MVGKSGLRGLVAGAGFEGFNQPDGLSLGGVVHASQELVCAWLGRVTE